MRKILVAHYSPLFIGWLGLSCVRHQSQAIGFVSVNLEDYDDSQREAFLLEDDAYRQLEHTGHPWWQLLPLFRDFFSPTEFSVGRANKDREQLQSWLRAQGWPTAEVTVTSSTHSGPWYARLPSALEGVDLLYNIKLGSQQHVRGWKIAGEVDWLDAAAGVWTLERQDQITSKRLQRYWNKGYRDAAIEWREDSELTDVLVGKVELGQRYEFAGLEVRGADSDRFTRSGNLWPEEYLAGKEYSQAIVQRLTSRLNSLPTITMTAVNEVVVDDDKVRLLIDLSEPKRWSSQSTVTLASDATVFSLQGGFAWKHVRSRVPVLELSGRHEVGYRVFPFGATDSLDFRLNGLNADQRLQLHTSPSPLSGLSLMTSLLGNVEAQIGYHQALFSSEFGVIWHPSKELSAKLALEADWLGYYPMLQQPQIFRDKFVEEGLLVNAFVPHIYASVELRPDQHSWMQLDAMPYAMVGENTFSRFYFRSEWRIPMNRWTIRPRFQGGLTHWWTDRSPLLAYRFFSGGAMSVRGFPFRQLSYPGFLGDATTIQTGGDVLLLGSIEGRYRFWREWTALSFVDAGRVWDTLFDDVDTWGRVKKGFDLNDVQPTIGAGVMIPTPFGDFNFVYGARIKEDSGLANELPRGIVHIYVDHELGGY